MIGLASNVPNSRPVDAERRSASSVVQSFASGLRAPPSCGGSGLVVAELAEQSIELVERSEGDRDLAALRLACAVAQSDLHVRRQGVGELSLETKNVARFLTFRALRRRLSRIVGGASGDELLGVADAHPLGDDFVGRLDLLRATEREQRPSMPHLDRAAKQQLLYRVAQLQKTQQIRRGAAGSADGPG